MELPEREDPLYPVLRLPPVERLTEPPEEERPELTEERLPLRDASVVLAEREAADTPEREADEKPEREVVETPEREVLAAERLDEAARVVRLPAEPARIPEPPEETVPVRTERELEPTRELRDVPTRVEVILRTSERKAPPRAL